jgi:hypothetical protein
MTRRFRSVRTKTLEFQYAFAKQAQIVKKE